MRIGALTIGQAPRTDILAVMGEMLRGVEILQAGALDGLDERQIAALAPAPGEYVLVTRLRDGREVLLSRERIFDRVQAALDVLAPQVDLVVFLCTGEFPNLRCERLLVEPDRVLRHMVQAVASGRRLGVLIPHPDQAVPARKRWDQVGVVVAVEPASPYREADFTSAARSLQARGTEAVVMDCMGYSIAHRRLVAEAAGVPTVLAASAVALAVRELLPPGPELS